jgi:hypothetical protein
MLRATALACSEMRAHRGLAAGWELTSEQIVQELFAISTVHALAIAIVAALHANAQAVRHAEAPLAIPKSMRCLRAHDVCGAQARVQWRSSQCLVTWCAVCLPPQCDRSDRWRSLRVCAAIVRGSVSFADANWAAVLRFAQLESISVRCRCRLCVKSDRRCHLCATPDRRSVAQTLAAGRPFRAAFPTVRPTASSHQR